VNRSLNFEFKIPSTVDVGSKIFCEILMKTISPTFTDGKPVTTPTPSETEVIVPTELGGVADFLSTLSERTPEFKF